MPADCRVVTEVHIGGSLVMKLVKPTKIASRAGMSWASTSSCLPRQSPRWEQLRHPFCGKRMLLRAGKWAAASICRMVLATIEPKPSRCSWVMVARRYWTSTSRLRTKTTKPTTGSPVIQD